MNQEDINLIKDFENDVKTNGIDSAINNFENNILTLNLSEEEFDKKVVFVNTVKSLNYEHPDLFINTNASKSWWRCGLASIALAASIAGLGSCITVVACGLAVLLNVNAAYAFADQCL